MPKATVKVCIRTRPTANFAHAEIGVDPDKGSVTINQHPGAVPDDGAPYNKQDAHKFKYHHVIHNASQETVYHTLTQDVVTSVMDGVNGTIMSYGQTGAGKTFTMIGDTRNYQHRGVAPRAVSDIFAEAASRIETDFEISVSYMEIYNERIFDLLDNKVGESGQADFEVIEDAKRGVFVRGLTQVEVTTEGDALNQLFNGELQRTTATHLLNKRSNRSHCIFTVHVSQRSRTGISEKVLHSKLHLVDLAGSERLKKTMDDSGDSVDDTIKKESMYINQSLTYLEQCVVSLSRKQIGHVPYRQTKLTHVLKDALGGNCNTLMFACIWGERHHLEETISTLRLAQRMMKVTNTISVNVDVDPMVLVKKYEKQIKDLKQELMMHDALTGERSGVQYDEYTPEQRDELALNVRRFIEAPEEKEDDVLDVQSMRHVKELFRQFKQVVLSEQTIAARAREVASRGGTLGGNLDGTYPDGAMTGDAGLMANDPSRVGELEDGHGFAIGAASADARPTTIDGGFRAPEGDDAVALSPAKQATFAEEDFAPPPLDRNEAYSMFKDESGPGYDDNNVLVEAKKKLRELKVRTKDASLDVNQNKAIIDNLKDRLEVKKQQRLAEQADNDMEEDVLDEEEFRLMKQDREAKKAYRAVYSDLKLLKRELDDCTKDVSQRKNQLIEDFERWHAGGPKFGANKSSNNFDDDEPDQMDDGEKFEQMELDRVTEDDPDSLAFFQAQKHMKATANLDRTSNLRKQKLKRKN